MSERVKVTSKTPESKRDNSVSQTRKTDFSQSINSPVDHVLFLQKTIGNQAVQRLFKSGVIQAKLRIGQLGDIYEQEADRVAEQVMRMPEPPLQRQAEEEEEEEELIQTTPLAEQITPLVQRQAEPEEEEEEIQMVQRQIEGEKEGELQIKEIPGQTSGVTPNPEARINAIRGGGQPLPASTRAFFEPRFGYDFSQVRIHTDARAAETARTLNARAFTVGQDVVFGAGQYSPRTAEGRKLLAHEITHVVQQGDAESIIQLQTVSQGKRYLRDIPVPKLGAYGIPSWKFEETEEYKSYMNPNLKWQLRYSVTKVESLLACRLIVNDLGLGKRVNWEKEAFSYIKQARGKLSKKEEGTERKEEITKEKAISEREILKECGEFEDAQVVVTKKWDVGPVDLEIRGYHKGLCCAYFGARVIPLKWPKERPLLRKNVRWEVKALIGEARAIVRHKPCQFGISGTGKVTFIEAKGCYSLYTLLLFKRGVEFLDKFTGLRDILRESDPEVCLVVNLTSQITGAKSKDKLIRAALAVTGRIDFDTNIPLIGLKLSGRLTKTCKIGFLEIGMDRRGKLSSSGKLEWSWSDCIGDLFLNLPSHLKIEITKPPEIPFPIPQVPMPRIPTERIWLSTSRRS